MAPGARYRGVPAGAGPLGVAPGVSRRAPATGEFRRVPAGCEHEHVSDPAPATGGWAASQVHTPGMCKAPRSTRRVAVRGRASRQRQK